METQYFEPRTNTRPAREISRTRLVQDAVRDGGEGDVSSVENGQRLQLQVETSSFTRHDGWCGSLCNRNAAPFLTFRYKITSIRICIPNTEYTDRGAVLRIKHAGRYNGKQFSFQPCTASLCTTSTQSLKIQQDMHNKCARHLYLPASLSSHRNELRHPRLHLHKT
jgi:hypothetical protein